MPFVECPQCGVTMWMPEPDADGLMAVECITCAAQFEYDERNIQPLEEEFI